MRFLIVHLTTCICLLIATVAGVIQTLPAPPADEQQHKIYKSNQAGTGRKPTTKDAAGKFEIIDSMTWEVTGKPDLQALYGITRGVMLYHTILFPECRHHPCGNHDYSDWLDEDAVRQIIRAYPDGTTFILNLEGPSCDAWGKYPWQWYTHQRKNLQLVQENLDRLIRAVEFCRSINPSNRWSVYGHTPHWHFEDMKSPHWRRMVRECKPLTDVLDFCCPYFYLSAESIVDPADKTESYWWRERPTEEWLAAMRFVLDSCDSAYDAPVYAFIWPEYYWPNFVFRGHADEDMGEYPYATFAQREMPEGVWQQVVDTARNHADGLAIWGVGGTPEAPTEWDESWPWWNVVRKCALRSKGVVVK